MLDLFNEYCNQGKTKQALLVGHNMLNKNPSSEEIFDSYFEFLLFLAKKSDGASADNYLQSASVALAFFSENATLNAETVEYILEKQDKLDSIFVSTQKRKEEERREVIKNEVAYNNDALDLMEKVLSDMNTCVDEKTYEKSLDQLGKLDKSIRRENLSSNQEEKYSSLSKKTSEIVSRKIEYFNKIKNRDYNIRAIEAYERIFNMFKNGNVSDNHKEVVKSLFSFDTSKLYNETLVYYNHVYNYILNKLGDDEKFIFTKYAIMSEKMR